MNITFIDSQEDLDEFEATIAFDEQVSLDTEFVRRDTYYAKLSLIQLCIQGKIYIIDCLKVNIKKLWEKIANHCQIICHAPRQDFEILFHETGILPKNVFDTQLAAKFVGYREHMSYRELCHDICNIELDKSHQNCNWLVRKVTNAMMKYAASDVLYLEDIYHSLNDKLIKGNKQKACASAINVELLDQTIYRNKCANAWKRIKFNRRNPELIERMKILAFHREEAAADLNIPKGFLLSDSQLVAICKLLPINDSELKQIQNLSKHILKSKNKDKLFDLCAGLRD